MNMAILCAWYSLPLPIAGLSVHWISEINIPERGATACFWITLTTGFRTTRPWEVSLRFRSVKQRCCILERMADKKLSKKEVQKLQAEIEEYEKKPVGAHERRVRIDGSFENAVKKMANTPPISNKELKEWAKKQREEIEE